MELDQLLDLCSRVCIQLLPICGVIVLIFLAMFLKHLVDVMKDAKTTVSQINDAMVTVNKELKDLEKPLNTLNELSTTVDQVHEASRKAVKSSIAIILDNLSNIKAWLMQALKPEEEEETSQQSKDDENE